MLNWIDVSSDEQGGAPFVAAGLYAEQPSEDVSASVNAKGKAQDEKGLLQLRAEIPADKWKPNVPFLIQVENTDDGAEVRLMRSVGASFECILRSEAASAEKALEALWSTVLDLVACYEQWSGFLAYYALNKDKINPFSAA